VPAPLHHLILAYTIPDAILSSNNHQTNPLKAENIGTSLFSFSLARYPMLTIGIVSIFADLAESNHLKLRFAAIQTQKMFKAVATMRRAEACESEPIQLPLRRLHFRHCVFPPSLS